MGKLKKNKKGNKPTEVASTDKRAQKKREGELLAKILALFGAILILFFAGHLFVNSLGTFDSKGVEFKVVREGELIFYQTQVPIYSEEGEKITDYNFYLRTDPRELEKIPFEEQFELPKLVALNYSDEMDCNGYGIIVLTNLITLYKFSGAKITIDKNATCDPRGRYLFLNLQKSESTGIEKIGANCYNLNINNCELFPPTEKFMLETLAKIKEENIRLVTSSAE